MPEGDSKIKKLKKEINNTGKELKHVETAVKNVLAKGREMSKNYKNEAAAEFKEYMKENGEDKNPSELYEC